MAPTLVAERSHELVAARIGGWRRRTWAESLHDGIDVLRLDAVDDKVAAARHEMTTVHDLNSGLAQSQHAFVYYNIQKCYPTKSRNSATNVSNLSGRSQAWTLQRQHVSVFDGEESICEATG
jgi:hypothetical protein